MNEKEHKFPSNAAWQGVLKEFKPLLLGRTECSEAFAFAAALTCISMAVGKSVQLEYGKRIRLNLFILLLGGANDSHKGLPIGLTSEFLHMQNKIHDDMDSEIIRAIDSGEGFIEMLPESGMAAVLMDEIAPIFKKGSAKSSTIQTTLINAYDGTELGRGTVKCKLWFPDHFISMLAGSNPGLITENLRYIDAESGLLGRYLVFWGKRPKLVSWPEATDLKLLNHAMYWLQVIHVDNHMKPRVISPTDEAKEYWHQAYAVLQQDIEQTDDHILQEIWKRLHLNIIKMAGLFAAVERHDVISLSDMKRAAAIGAYAARSAEKLRECIGKTPRRSIDDRIVAYLEKVNRPASKREIQQHVRGKDIDAMAFNMSLGHLEVSGAIEQDLKSDEYYLPGATMQRSTEKEAAGEKP